jgi:hypothetical protein
MTLLRFTLIFALVVAASAKTPIEFCLLGRNQIYELDFDGCVELPCPIEEEQEKTLKISFESSK